MKGIERDIGRGKDREIVYAGVVELRSEFRVQRDGSEQLRKSKLGLERSMEIDNGITFNYREVQFKRFCTFFI